MQLLLTILRRVFWECFSESWYTVTQDSMTIVGTYVTSESSKILLELQLWILLEFCL